MARSQRPVPRLKPQAAAVNWVCVLIFFTTALGLTAAAVSDAPRVSPSLSVWTSGTIKPFGSDQAYKLDVVQDNTPVAEECGYGPMDRKQWPFSALVSVSSSGAVAQRPGDGCGTCLAIKCTDGRPQVCNTLEPITVFVFDHCEDCDENTLALHTSVMEELASSEFDTVQVEYTQVPCQAPGGVQVRVISWDPDNDSKLQIVISNIAGDGGITSVSISPVAAHAVNHVDDTGEQTQSRMAMSNTLGAVWEVIGLPKQGPGFGYDLEIQDAVGGVVMLSNAIPPLTNGGSHLHTYSFAQQFDAATTRSTVLQASPSPDAGVAELVMPGGHGDLTQRFLQEASPKPAAAEPRTTPPQAALWIPEDEVHVGNSNASTSQPQSAAPSHSNMDWNVLKNKGAVVGGNVTSTSGVWLPGVNSSTSAVSPPPAVSASPPVSASHPNGTTPSPVPKQPRKEPKPSARKPRNRKAAHNPQLTPKPSSKPCPNASLSPSATSTPAPTSTVPHNTTSVVCNSTDSNECQQAALQVPLEPPVPGKLIIPEDEIQVATNGITNTAVLNAAPSHTSIDWSAIKNSGVSVGGTANTNGSWVPGASMPTPPPPAPRAHLVIPEDLVKVAAVNGTVTTPPDAAPAHHTIDWVGLQNKGVSVGAASTPTGSWLPGVQPPASDTPNPSPPLVASAPPVAKPTCNPPVQ